MFERGSQPAADSSGAHWPERSAREARAGGRLQHPLAALVFCVPPPPAEHRSVEYDSNRQEEDGLGFVPIGIDDYVVRHLKSNPGDSIEEITAALRAALRAHRSGVRCDCGEPIWVIGSAVAGFGCFSCITGEAYPEDDFELADVTKAVR